MRPQSFPSLPEVGRHSRVHRFDLPFAVNGAVGSCRVEIFDREVLAPQSPLTVLISNTPGQGGPSATTYIELVCALIWQVYIVPLGLASKQVRWVQRWPTSRDRDDWREVCFRDRPGRFRDPRWIPTEPLQLDWGRLLEDTCWVEDIRLVAPTDIADEDIWFTPDDCHREFTGICSLDDPVPSGLGRGQSAWRHCRQLARMAEVWRLIAEYVGPERSMAELDTRALEVDRELFEYIEQKWHSDFGCVPEILPAAIHVAVTAFGPRQSEPVAISGAVPYELTNGRHRACVARRLNIPLCATIGVIRARQLAS